jgi:MscS family membrane protein
MTNLAIRTPRWIAALGALCLAGSPARARLAGTPAEPSSLSSVDWAELGEELWAWSELVLVALAAFVAAWLVSWPLLRLARKFAARSDTQADDRLVDNLAMPTRLLIALGLFTFAFRTLGLGVHTLVAPLSLGFTVVLVTWLVLRVVDFLGVLLLDKLEETGNRAAVAIVPLGRRVAKAFLLAIAGVVLLQNLGFNVTGLIAGLGVGGLAVALAAQKTIANLFGGVSLITDQPVRVGDFCRFADGKVGTVEEIGLRSTRIRTLDRTLVSIPNSDFSEFQLENFAVRDRMRLFAMLGLRYETSPDQLRHVLAGLRKLLAAHPKVTESPARVRFVNFGAHSLDLEVFAYVQATDWDEFLEVREDLFLRMMDVVRESGTGFAFPSQTLYLGRDGGLDEELTEKAEQTVRGWRERNELPFPRFSEEFVAEVDGTLDWPPRGSATAEAAE